MKSRTALRSDPWLFLCTALLLSLSVLMVFSTTALFSSEVYGDSTAMLVRHIIHIGVGLGIFFLCSRLEPMFLRKLAVPMLVVSFILLLLVLVLGKSAGGAQRWFALGPLRVQPGELAKLMLIIYFAAYIERYRGQMHQFVPGTAIPLITLSVFGLLLLLEPDFGTTAVLFLVVSAQLFLVTRIRYMLWLALFASTSAAILVANSPYRLKRFLAFLDPFNDPTKSGYQLIQSLIAVGSGGLWGEGLGSGQQKLFYLPAAHTDFIFAVIAEELGLLGALAVILLFVVILFRGILIVQRLADDAFLCSLALGCTLLLVLPAMLNVAVVLGLLPTKGMVLPLVAYGGTAMMVHLAAMGLLLRLSKVEP